MKQRLIPAVLYLLLAACASSPDEREPIKPADQLYREANASFRHGNYLRAEDQLKQVMSRYPFTDYAVQAHLDILYVFLELDDPESLAEEADRFIRENPRHPRIDYAYYMKGMGYYRRVPNPLERLASIDIASRSVLDAETAMRNFAQLAARFPDSPYTADAKLRMIELKNRMARHEILIADFYMRQGAWISALRRAKRVVTELQGTPAEIDALMIMVRSYEELGLDDLAETARRVLAANPGREPVVLGRD